MSAPIQVQVRILQSVPPRQGTRLLQPLQRGNPVSREIGHFPVPGATERNVTSERRRGLPRRAIRMYTIRGRFSLRALASALPTSTHILFVFHLPPLRSCSWQAGIYRATTALSMTTGMAATFLEAPATCFASPVSG